MTVPAPSPLPSPAVPLDACALADIPEGGGVCVRAFGAQVAVFRVAGRVFALDNRDPFTGANVLSRGLTGGRGDRLTVASPLLKHAFDLESGECLDDPGVRVRVYPARVEGGRVLLVPAGAP